jgi:hypothetical protein
MGGNIAGIYGAQIFRQDDKPLYQRGFAVNISILVAGLLLAVVRYVDDRLRRRKQNQLGVIQPVLESASDNNDGEKGVGAGSDTGLGKGEKGELK